nr:copia protein [Tanacetum cinerariifolium]
MGCCLTSWFSKKQTVLAISTTEDEYVSAEKACQQALWMKQALIDYGIRLDDVPIMCDNKGAIDLSKNPVQHSRTKHIEIRHHFLRDNVQKGNISIEKVSSEDNIADILTKPLKREPFNYLRLGLELDISLSVRNWCKLSCVRFSPPFVDIVKKTIEFRARGVDTSRWLIILYGNSIDNAPPITKVVEGVETIIAPSTAEEKAQRRNKPEIETLSLDDLYNNLKIYELEVKGTSSSNTNIQNVAFKSSNSTNNTNRALNTAYGATTASIQATDVNSTTIDNLSDASICSFFASQPNSSQLDNEDLQQIYLDDLEEMDLRWQMAMLTVK